MSRDHEQRRVAIGKLWSLQTSLALSAGLKDPRQIADASRMRLPGRMPKTEADAGFQNPASSPSRVKVEGEDHDCSDHSSHPLSNEDQEEEENFHGSDYEADEDWERLLGFHREFTADIRDVETQNGPPCEVVPQGTPPAPDEDWCRWVRWAISVTVRGDSQDSGTLGEARAASSAKRRATNRRRNRHS